MLALPAAVLVAVTAPALPALQIDDASESKTQGRPDERVEKVEKVSVEEGRMSEEARAARGEGATTEERGEVEVARGYSAPTEPSSERLDRAECELGERNEVDA
ncbi:hypothetical protein EPN29_13650 [bacterium]|nr:MAG: hypothetical protein EPN29_13650 [bacterium]